MDIQQLRQIISGVEQIAIDCLGDECASVNVTMNRSDAYLQVYAKGLRGGITLRNGENVGPAHFAEMFLDWVGGQKWGFPPGRYAQIERRISDLFTDIGPTPTQAGVSADHTIATIKEKCETGLKLAIDQKADSDDLLHLSRMIGTVRVCERILGIIEGAEQ